MLILGTRRTRRAALALASLPFLVCQACQPGLLTTPAVSPVPPLVLGLPLYLMPEPTIFKLDDPSGRPLAITLEHEVRDALEAAGFKLAPTPEAANGVVARLVIQKVSALEQDVFIKGGEACGVRLEILRGAAVLGSAEPEVQCLATSSYYGMLPKDAAITMVNKVGHAAALVAAAESLRTTTPAPASSASGPPARPPPATPAPAASTLSL
jgi:hypothetical protein